MPFRRLADYGTLIIYMVGLVFVGGGLYSRVINIESTLEKRAVYIEHDKQQDLAIKELQINALHRDRFYATFEEFVNEMKTNNKEMARKIETINETVIGTKYKVEAIEKGLPKP